MAIDLSALAGIVANSTFGGSEKSKGEPGGVEQAAKAVGTGDSGLGSTVGSTLGGIAGSVFGPAGSAVGAAVGGHAGSLAEKAGSVPGGPGATIESGTVDTSQSNAQFSSAALSVAQSMQSLATRGFKNQPAADGNKKTF